MAKIFVSFNVVTVDKVLVLAKELNNLSAEVYRSAVFNPPHSQRNLTIDNLNPVMHRVQVWGTTDGTTLTSLKGSCDIDASQTTTDGFRKVQFIVDGGVTGAPRYDPVSNQDSYLNPDLPITTGDLVFKSGYGPLFWGLNINPIPGGFQFIDGQVFSTGEEYTVQVANLLTVATPTAGKSYPSGIIEIAANTTFNSTHYGKMIEVNAGSDITITIPTIAAIPDNTVFTINTHKFLGVNVTLSLPALSYLLVNSTPRNQVYIGVAESLTVIKLGAYLRIVEWDGDYRRLGDRISTERAPFNSLPETGGWKLKTAYKRFFNWYVSELPAGTFFTATDDSAVSAANKGFFGIGATKFWMPDRRGMFDRISDGTVPAGTFADMDVQQHFHPDGVQVNDGGPSDPTPAAGFNRAPAHTVIAWLVSNHVETAQFASTELNASVSGETRPKNISTLIFRII